MLKNLPWNAMVTQVKKVATRPRNIEASRKELLSAAFHEVFHHGFQGVSIDNIVAQTSLTKGAFFHQFPSKLDLGYALVDEVITPMLIERWSTPLESFDNPILGILELLNKHIGSTPSTHLKLGCPLNNLVQEMSAIDKGFKKRLNKALNIWISELERHLEKGKQNGYVKFEASSNDIAQFVVMSHEGFYGMMKGFEHPQDLFFSLFNSLKIYLNHFETKKSKEQTHAITPTAKTI